MRKLTIAVVVAALAGAVVIAMFRARGSPPRTSRAENTRPAPIQPALPPGPAPRLPPEAAESELSPPDEESDLAAMVAEIDSVDGKLASVEKLERTLALYREVSVYPPWSRPAAEGASPHLLQPNAPASLGQPFAVDAERRPIRTDLTLDRWFIGPGETATATLTITREDQPGAAYEPTAALLRVEYYDPQAKVWPVAAQLPLTRRGDQLMAVIDPAAIPVLAAADPPPEVRLLAHVEIGVFFKDLPILFRYASEQALEVVGSAGDRVANGSLEVDLEANVLHLAPTLVQAVLYDAAGTRPIATYEKPFQPTRTGRQIVTLQFFGKALRDAGVNGPYRLKGLHGHVLAPGAESGERFWSRADDPALMTRAYSSNQFSDAPWSSLEKERMVARYRELIEQGGM